MANPVIRLGCAEQRAGDNWESTYVFWPIYFSFVASALIFGFGGQYKRPIWTNWQLVLSGAGLFAFGSYMILSDENSFTRIFHVASEQFNYAGEVLFSREVAAQSMFSASLRSGRSKSALF